VLGEKVNMRLRKWLVLTLVFLFGCISLIYAQDDSSTGWEFLYEDIIPEEELQQKIIDALNGDPLTAKKLEYHYSSLLMRNHLEAFKWTVIAAENGAGDGHYLLSGTLINNNFESRTRGIFWLYTMVKNGYRKTEDDLIYYGYTQETAKPPDDDHFPYNYLQLSENEISNCRTGALQGNGKAAFLLGKYYSEIKVDSELSENWYIIGVQDSSPAEYWYRVGAQNGSPECQYELGQILLKKDDELNKIRGNFWLRQAAQNGYNIE
jgi:hypothetical protein